MGADAVRAAIEAEGQARIRAVRREAEQEAARIRAESASLAEERRASSLREVEEGLRRETGARIAAARADARARVLEAREALVARILANAELGLSTAIESPVAQPEMIARAEWALTRMPLDRPVVFSCSDGSTPSLTNALRDREGVEVECDPDIPAGFRAVCGGESVLIDATPSALLNLDRKSLAIEIMGRLDRESEEDPS